MPAFRRQAHAAGMDEAAIAGVIDRVAADPMAGDEIVGTGGCRKIRVAGRGKGKSGQYRVITFYSGPALPVFLLGVLLKGVRADLTQAERNSLRGITTAIVKSYRDRT